MNLVPLWDSLAAAVEETSPEDRRVMHDARTRLADVTERMIAAALAEYEQIEAMSESQPWYARPENPLCRRVGLIVREMFREWTKQVEEVEARARRSSLLTFRPVLAHLERLLNAQGRTLAMLNITYEAMDEAIAEDRRGEGVTIEQLRARIKEQKAQQAAKQQVRPEGRAALEEQVA